MIAVIADDLTGASELGGLALRYNLRVEVTTEVNLHTKADVLIIAADTRSKKQHEAVSAMEQVTLPLLLLKPTFIFKKIDSILRGHVLAEIMGQMKVMNLKRALLVSANPALQRTIKDKTYFFNGRPIHESGFYSDPEFPITSSSIRDMLRVGKETLHIIKPGQPMPPEGIIVGEVENQEHLKAWANMANPANTLIAGASGFFLSMLDKISLPANPPIIDNSVNHPILLVCGSAFDKSQAFVKNEKDSGRPVNYMPCEIVDAENPTKEQYEQWALTICNTLRRNGRTIIAIDPDTTRKTKVSASALRKKTAHIVHEVFQRTSVPELILEGGSTAAAILRELKISKFHPTKEMAPGVVRMRVDSACLPAGKTSHLNVVFKPGSYAWPAGSWEFNQTN